MTKITTLFLDIGGVILTDGWNRFIRERAIIKFNLDKSEFDSLHKLYYNLHEQGKISLSDYLDKVIFWKKRDFTKSEFEAFMKDQSESHPDMIKFISELKKKYNLKIAAVSNEGRDLAEFRIKKFNLTSFIDTFIISSFVGYQKPDPRIYHMALDITQANIHEVIYLDDRSYLIDDALKLGIQGILHTTLQSTKKELELIGL